MLKKIVNEARFTLRITTTGPILIRSGHASISGPDMTPVLTYRNGRQEVFLPGSSLKGVFRSHLEKIICSLKSQVVCYPFSGVEEKEADLKQRRRDYRDSCGATFEKEKKSTKDAKRLEEWTDLIYAESCPACRLFGSTGFIGRVSIGDAHLVSTEIKELRDGVGIDRLTGGASHGAKFELEVVSTGVAFETDVYLRNFEIWQLGMLFIVLQDLEDGLIRIGSGRSRGLGGVTAQLAGQTEKNSSGGVVTSTMRSHGEPQEQLWGLGRWLNDESYGTWKDDLLTLSLPGKRADRGIRVLRTFQGDALKELREQSVERCVERMRNWPPPSVAKVREQFLASQR
jgi:CRISPR-associated RAMP protein (TIGR02581 family)